MITYREISLHFLFQVCLEKMQDLQLALVISRLYESEFETASTYKKILQRHVLGQDKQVHSVYITDTTIYCFLLSKIHYFKKAFWQLITADTQSLFSWQPEIIVCHLRYSGCSFYNLPEWVICNFWFGISDSSPPWSVPAEHGSLGPGGLQQSLGHSARATC